jgi:hypothetical protein
MAAHCVEKRQPAMVLTDEVVTKYGMMIGIPVLLAFLFFIIWGLTKEADTGRFGKLMMYLVLGGGFFSFMIKIFLEWWIGRGMQ